MLNYSQGLVKGAKLCFRYPYFYFRHGESTSIASQLTSPASQKSMDLNKVSLLLQDLGHIFEPTIKYQICASFMYFLEWKLNYLKWNWFMNSIKVHPSRCSTTSNLLSHKKHLLKKINLWFYVLTYIFKNLLENSGSSWINIILINFVEENFVQLGCHYFTILWEKSFWLSSAKGVSWLGKMTITSENVNISFLSDFWFNHSHNWGFETIFGKFFSIGDPPLIVYFWPPVKWG